MKLLRSSLVSVAVFVGACGGKTEDAPAPDDTGIDTAIAVDSSPVVDSTPARDTTVPDGTTAPGVMPPPRPTTTATGGATRWFAVQRFQLGVTRLGTTIADPNAWKDFGFDLDGRTTTNDDSKTSNNSCKRRPGSPSFILADGNAGRDNNFGGHFMQTLKSLKSDIEDAVNQGPLNGDVTLLIRLDGVGPADNAHVPGALYIAGPFAGGSKAPTFTEADVWPVTPDSLTDGATIAKSRFAFPDGYMVGGVWVSGDFGGAAHEIPIPLFLSLTPLSLEAGIVTFDTTGGAGMIAGGAPVDGLSSAMAPTLEKFGICPGNATYDQVVATLTESADLVAGAPQLQDTTKECDTLSVGVGFLAKPTGAPTTTSPPPPPPPPSDAGGC